MKVFEVRVLYHGSETYMVEAEDEDQASDLARDKFENGEEGIHTGSEFEEFQETVIIT